MRDRDSKTSEARRPRTRLGAKLHGLHVRLTHARTMLSPRTYVGDPWLRLAAAFAVGYRLGSREQPKPTAVRPFQGESLVHALLRTGLLNLAESTINEAMSNTTTTEQENHHGSDKRQAQR